MTTKTKPTLRETILAAVGSDTDWMEIVASVEAKHTIRAGGWMRVRGELQGLLNAGLVKRIDDVHAERFCAVVQHQQPTNGKG